VSVFGFRFFNINVEPDDRECPHLFNRLGSPHGNGNLIAIVDLGLTVHLRLGSLGPEGTRVNAVSAGPIRTLAASGIKNFRKMLAANEAQTPLRRQLRGETIGMARDDDCAVHQPRVGGDHPGRR